MEADLIKMESVRSGLPSKTQIAPNRLHEAIQLLESREFPEENGVRLSAIALHESFETVFPHYVALGELDCPRLRLRLGRDLMASYLSSSQLIQNNNKLVTEKSVDQQKSAISAAIQTMLTESKYPLPVEALSDALILREAMKEGLFHATPDQRRELTLLTDELHRDVHDFLSDVRSSTQGDSWEKAALILRSRQKTKSKSTDATLATNQVPIQSPSLAPQVEFLKVDSQIQKIKPNLLREIEASAKYLAHVRALLSKVKSS